MSLSSVKTVNTVWQYGKHIKAVDLSFNCSKAFYTNI